MMDLPALLRDFMEPVERWCGAPIVYNVMHSIQASLLLSSTNIYHLSTTSLTFRSRTNIIPG